MARLTIHGETSQSLLGPPDEFDRRRSEVFGVAIGFH